MDLVLKGMEALKHTSLWAPREGAAFSKFTEARLDFFHKEEEEDQFPKDSVQDLMTLC